MEEQPLTAVDISSWTCSGDSSEHDRDLVVKAFARDLCESGFIRICGHGVPQDVLDRVFKESRHFFRQPLEHKREAYSQDRARRGYSDHQSENYASLMGSRAPNDSVEKYRVGRVVDDGCAQETYYTAREARTHFMPNTWPHRLPDFQPALEEYYRCMEGLSHTILAILEESLDLDSGCLCQHMHRHTSILTLNYFPVEVLTDERVERIAAHTDVSMITIVAQEQAVDGLEILSSQDGSWNPVPADERCLVVNIGDCLMDWTGGKAVSTVHRVVHNVGAPPEGKSIERLSIAYFVSPNYDAPMDQLSIVEGVSQGLTYSKWRKLRIRKAIQARK